MKLPLYSAAHEKVGELEVAGNVFGREGDVSLLHEAVRMQLANRRSGTASTKTKGLISGGGRKPWRQKGTGRARAGSTRSPIWRHGGTIFGPQPRDYSYKMPKKAWRAALCLAISDRAKNGKLFIVESLDLSEPKTKAAKAALVKLGVEHAFDRHRRRRTASSCSQRATSRRTRFSRLKGLTCTTCSTTGNS